MTEIYNTILQTIIKERLILEVSEKYKIPVEICNEMYDFFQSNPDDLMKTEVPIRPKFNNGDIFDPNKTPNEKPFYFKK
jgi:hypothetical protein